MRYLLISYITKPNGQIDEISAVSKNVKTKDWQTCSVILDFKEQKVLLASVQGLTAIKDWDTIVSYYYKYYTNIIERLFAENGHSIEKAQVQAEKT